MAEKHELRVAPHRPQRNKELVPVSRHQRIPERLRGDQKSRVFIKHRQRVPHCPAQGLHASLRDLSRLQLIQFGFGLWKGDPAQPIKEVVQVVTGGNRPGFTNKLFVGQASRKNRLFDEAHWCAGCSVQGFSNVAHLARRNRQQLRQKGLQPGLLPIHPCSNRCLKHRHR